MQRDEDIGDENHMAFVRPDVIKELTPELIEYGFRPLPEDEWPDDFSPRDEVECLFSDGDWRIMRLSQANHETLVGFGQVKGWKSWYASRHVWPALKPRDYIQVVLACGDIVHGEARAFDWSCEEGDFQIKYWRLKPENFETVFPFLMEGIVQVPSGRAH